ncbi:autotransporter adhesin [Massilia sp. UYP11]|uniref:YadA-like family protein n=1 Tax=Massilia sp. UYP11 TaxID=1756385 RepID=UPI003D25F546
MALGTNSMATAANTVSVGNAATSLTRRIVNVADGVASSDAATVGQLSAAIAAVGAGTPGPQGAQGIQGIQGVQGVAGAAGAAGRDGVDGKDGVVDYAQVNAHIDSRAADTLKAAATDATTKTNAVNERVSTVAAAVTTAQATADTALAGVDKAMQYTDATAVRTLQEANAYTDARVGQLGSRISALDGRISAVERAAYRGIAASLAMQQAPAAIGPGESAVTVGMGGYGGESAVAVGVHHVTRRNMVISGGVAASPNGGPVAWRAGGSFKF